MVAKLCTLTVAILITSQRFIYFIIHGLQKTLELNAEHNIIQELRSKAEVDQSDKTVKDLVWLM